MIYIGQEHLNIFRNMRSKPGDLGNRVELTVVAMEENLQNRNQMRESNVIQPDISVSGKRYANAYDNEIYGNLSQPQNHNGQYSMRRAADIYCRSNPPQVVLKLRPLNHGLVLRQRNGISTAPGGRRVGR
jgi:hypothetical protein